MHSAFIILIMQMGRHWSQVAPHSPNKVCQNVCSAQTMCIAQPDMKAMKRRWNQRSLSQKAHYLGSMMIYSVWPDGSSSISCTIHPNADNPGLLHCQWHQSQMYTVISFSCFLSSSLVTDASRGGINHVFLGSVMNRDTATGHVTGPYVYKPFPFSLFSLV